MDQRGWDREVNWRIYDIAIDCGREPTFPTTKCLLRWLRLHWRSFSTGMCTSEQEYASKSNALKNTTDSYGGGKLLIWSTSIFEQPGLMEQYKDCQICSMYVCRPTISRISMYDGTKLHYQQVKLRRRWSWKDCTSQNYRILFSVRLCRPCMIMELFVTLGNRVIKDWRRLWDVI